MATNLDVRRCARQRNHRARGVDPACPGDRPAGLGPGGQHSSRRPAPPPGDFGDAPVGDVADGIEAYPGVLARWVSWYQHRNSVTAPVQHLHGTWLQTGAPFRLGVVPPVPSGDSLQNPGAPENDADPVIILEALGPNPLAQMLVTVSTNADHDPAQPFYVNVFVDQNRTGEWKDGWHLGTPVVAWDLEWAIQDVPIRMPAAEARQLAFGYLRLADPTHPVWLRLIVSDAPIGAILKSGEPFWDATMLGSHGWRGEIEDHYLEFHATYQPGKGIFPWWVYGRDNAGGGGGGNPKPACDAFYVGPRVIHTPWCPGTVQYNHTYRVTERNGGCDPGILWGMYGLKHLAGVPVPPTITLQNGDFFLTDTEGDNTLTCPDGTELKLPDTVEGFDPMFQGHVSAATLRGGLVPAAFNACYLAPDRYRVYRAFLEVMTCGSAHHSVAVRTGPAHTHNPSVIESIGRRIDHVDFMAGNLVESFIDLEFGRPFPDPDFFDYAIVPLVPGGQGYLDEEMFASFPASLRLEDAMYSIRPWMPDPEPDPGSGSPGKARMSGVRFQYIALPSPDGENSVAYISTTGLTLTEVLPDADGWATFETTMPEDFELETILIALGNGWIDDLTVVLEPIIDCNGNGIHDAFDIASGTSLDLNGNGIPDECEPDHPCDGYCGTLSPAGCWCDELCVEFGDCCDDVTEFCAETGLTGVRAEIPTALAIVDAAPNPFNPQTTIRFDLPRGGEASVTVHDVRGRLVRTLWRGHREAGRYEITWDGRDDLGTAAPSGVYLMRLVTSTGAWQAVEITLAK